MRELCVQAPAPDVSGRRLGPAVRPAGRLGAALRACNPRGGAACASVCAGAAGRTGAGAALRRRRLALHRPGMVEQRRTNYFASVTSAAGVSGARASAAQPCDCAHAGCATRAGMLAAHAAGGGTLLARQVMQ